MIINGTDLSSVYDVFDDRWLLDGYFTSAELRLIADEMDKRETQEWKREIQEWIAKVVADSPPLPEGQQ
jgi:hypothetical protein